MIAIICGGRDYTNRARLVSVLDAAVTRLRLDTIIEGAAPGTDTLAKEWALARGDIGIIDVPADWKAEPVAAGPIRNNLMFRILCGGGTAVERAVIAFPGGPGTANMIALAKSPKALQMSVKLHLVDQ